MPSQAGALAGAAWAPDSRALLVAAAGAPQLAALCLTRPPPALDAQLLPLPLPAPPPAEHPPANGACDGGRDGEGFRVLGFAWDAGAARLAVAAGGARMAVYATTQRPVLAARLLDCLPAPAGARSTDAGDSLPALPAPRDAEAHEHASGADNGEASRETLPAGPGEKMLGVASAEQPAPPLLEFQGGGLLAVRWDDAHLTLHDCAAGF